MQLTSNTYTASPEHYARAASRGLVGTPAPRLTLKSVVGQSGSLFRAFRVMTVPTLIVIDAQGRIARRIEGGDAQLVSTLQAALTL